jgi:hypothetical protein
LIDEVNKNAKEATYGKNMYVPTGIREYGHAAGKDRLFLCPSRSAAQEIKSALL